VLAPETRYQLNVVELSAVTVALNVVFEVTLTVRFVGDPVIAGGA
jgi:hypothetical protein